MKNMLLAFAFLFAIGNSFGQTNPIDLTTGVTLLPFATATKLIESGTVTLLSPIASTQAAVQGRGVAGKEQLKDELVALNEDMLAGKVQSLEDVRQPALRELFEEISADEKQMNETTSVVGEGSEVHKIATAVTVTLMLE